jgi:hypothetical protein
LGINRRSLTSLRTCVVRGLVGSQGVSKVGSILGVDLFFQEIFESRENGRTIERTPGQIQPF